MLIFPLAIGVKFMAIFYSEKSQFFDRVSTAAWGSDHISSVWIAQLGDDAHIMLHVKIHDISLQTVNFIRYKGTDVV